MEHPAHTPPKTEFVKVALLKRHPRNYRVHPPEQLDHIANSITEHGFYRNIVIARDNTILAGHGVVAAVERMGLFGPETVPVIRLDVDPEDPRALKVLTGDNEMGRLAEVDDRLLTDILKGLADDDALLGTGFDKQTLSALFFVTRPESEVRDKNEAAEWIGMPEFEAGEAALVLTVQFRTAEDRETFVKQYEIGVTRKSKDARVWSGWWPSVEKMDRLGVAFEEEAQR